MAATLKTTTLAGFDGEVIVTEGAVVDGVRIYGVFADEDDARSVDADSLALGTVRRERLTDEQAADAADNSAAL